MDQFLIPAISALISGGIGLCGTLWQQKLKNAAIRQKDAALLAASQAAKKPFEENRYGFEVESAEVNVEIDSNGDAIIQRTWSGVKVVNKNFHLDRVPGRIELISPQSTLGKMPMCVSRERNRGRIGDLIPEVTSPERTSYHIPIDPPWTIDDHELSCSVEFKVVKAYLMKRVEVVEAFHDKPIRKEHHSHEILYPIRHLELSVKFPHHFAVTVDYGVLFGAGGVVHPQERSRVRFSWKEIQNRATIRVQEPLLAFRYFISWLPND